MNWNKQEKALEEEINNSMATAGLRAEFPSEAGLHPSAAGWCVSCTQSFTLLLTTNYSHPDIWTRLAVVGGQRGQKHGQSWLKNNSSWLIADSSWACQEANTLLEVRPQQRDWQEKMWYIKATAVGRNFLFSHWSHYFHCMKSQNHWITESFR